MTNYPLSDAIHINGINLWAHVGVLEEERLYGQMFLLDISLWLDLHKAAVNDDIAASVDYSIAISQVQKLSLEIHCLTIEKFSNKILDLLESLYGDLPMQILLTKCSPPINAFNGTVSVERCRNKR